MHFGWGDNPASLGGLKSDEEDSQTFGPNRITRGADINEGRFSFSQLRIP